MIRLNDVAAFSAGDKIASSGFKRSWTREELEASARAYDPRVHPAPLVLGHVSSGAPAHGWLESAKVDGDTLVFDVVNVTNEFADMLKDKKYRTKSISWYAPDNPRNPVQGTWYPRHLAALGAESPADKGLKDFPMPEEDGGEKYAYSESFEFDEGDDGIEFADILSQKLVAATFRRLREWIMTTFSKDVADTVIPSYEIEELEAWAIEREVKARLETEAVEGVAIGTNFSETPKSMEAVMPNEDVTNNDGKTVEVVDFSEQKKALEEKEAALKAMEFDFAERLAAHEKTLADIRMSNQVDFVESIKDRIPAKFRKGLPSVLDALEVAGEWEFSEELKCTPAEFLRQLLAGKTPGIDFSELTADAGDTVEPLTAEKLVEKAQAYQAEQLKLGNKVSISNAVSKVK